MPETEKKKETKEERKERKRLKKLKKEAKKNKKRKLEELQNGATEEMEVETPKAKKMKLSDDEKEEVNFDGISRAIIYASKEQLQYTLIKCVKATPSHIPATEKILNGGDVDESIKSLLSETEAKVKEEKEKEAAAAERAASGYIEIDGPKVTGVVLKWNHDRGFGFIKQDNGGDDLFVHTKNVIKKSGFKNAKTGSKVEFQVQSGEKGDSAVNVTAVGGEPCEGGMEMQGTVNSWLEERQFGFIRGDDGIDYFAGDRDIWIEAGVLTPGERVQFDIKRKDNGQTQAIFINTIGGEYYA